MKRTLKTLGMLIITVLLTLGLAQQTQQTQETGQQTQQPQETQQTQESQQTGQQAQETQQQQQMQQSGQTTQGQQFGQDQVLVDTLMELRELHRQLGQIINEIEGQLGFSPTGGLEARITGLERGARAGALQQARRDLRDLRADIEAGDRAEETAREIGQIRSDLRRAFAGATGEEQQRVTELEEQFRTLEERVRAGDEEAQTTFEETLNRIEEDIERGQQQFEQEGRQRDIQMALERLEGLRADIEGGRYHAGVTDDIGQIRSDLQRSFQNAQEESLQRLDEEFGRLDEQVRAGSPDASSTLIVIFGILNEELQRDTNILEEDLQRDINQGLEQSEGADTDQDNGADEGNSTEEGEDEGQGN